MAHKTQWGGVSMSDDVPYSPMSDIGALRVGYLAKWNQLAKHK